MPPIISKILKSILAYVKLTLVASAANIWKICQGISGDLYSKFEAYIFVLSESKNEENRTMRILNISFETL